MTRPNPIVSSALATAVVNLLAAWVIISVLRPEAPSMDAQKLRDAGSLYRLSPIPAGADWDRS
jgi:hypothetical protein